MPKVDVQSRLIVESLEDSKAEDITVINLAGKSDMADYMIIASGRSDRHVSAIAEHLSQKLKASGVSSFSIEGLRDGNWVLIDVADIIVHIFRPEVRDFYGLEKMWNVALPVDECVMA